MKFYGLDGNQYKLQLNNRSFDIDTLSKLAKKAYSLLKEMYPFDTILIEVTLCGTKIASNKDLIADFLIPKRNLIIEVDGRQHNVFTKFFHEDKLSFYRSTRRDKSKEEWARINNFTLVRLQYNESREEWRQKILSSRAT